MKQLQLFQILPKYMYLYINLPNKKAVLQL